MSPYFVDPPPPLPEDPLGKRPEVSAAEAQAAAREEWGVEGEVALLPGERDRNFLLTDADGARFVVKFANLAEPEVRLDLQTAMVAYARKNDPGLQLPETISTTNGAERVTRTVGTDSSPQSVQVRLLRYREGRPLSSFRRRPEALLDAVGRFMGRLQRALAGFDHPGLDSQDIPWAPDYARSVLAAAPDALRDAEQRRLYERISLRCDLNHLLIALPRAAIHNDANDDNLLLTSGEPEAATPERLALLDFGDALRGPAIVEAANAALYLTAATPDPLRVAATVLRGFASERPVNSDVNFMETVLFRSALAMRALVSTGIAALRTKSLPATADDPYLLTSQDAMWRFLESLDREPGQISTSRFRIAVGEPPFWGAHVPSKDVERAVAQAMPPIALGDEVLVLDLSPTSEWIAPGDPITTLRELLDDESAIAIGRTREPRCFQLGSEDTRAPAPLEPATIELGIEVFAPAGTPVTAPFGGKVAWVKRESGDAGDGVCVGLSHTVGAFGLWSIYRGLTTNGTLATEQVVEQGDLLGQIADDERSPPHLHFQLLTANLDPLEISDGVPPPKRCALSDFSLFDALCPDPSAVFGLGTEAVAEVPATDDENLLEARNRTVSNALSVSYDKPITVVRGRGARLYDSAGRDYLDMVNNVCHVGHAHPRVVEAIAGQAALLNTNTRYLYRQLTDYTERLLATFPDRFEVVFLTNSGSEANDLALRIARTALGTHNTLVFDGGYHGNLNALIEVSPYKLDGKGGRSMPEWVHRLPMPDGFRGRFRAEDPAFPGNLIEDTERRVANAGSATLIGEAILSCGGQIVPPPGYLAALYRAVHGAGGVIIADEVQTGFGRVGPDFWAFLAVQSDDTATSEPELPDIVTLGKPAGNGHPLGAVVTTRELARSFENGMEYFNTFGGNPVSCAAGLAVLDVLRDEGLPEHAVRVGARLRGGLSDLATRYPVLGKVRGRGLFLGFEMVRDPETREPAAAEAKRVVNRLRDYRILNSTDGPDENIIKLKPPLVFNEADTDHYLETLDLVLHEQI